MKIVAIIAFQNEEKYLANSIRNFISNGIKCALIDNDSDDGSRDICNRPEFAGHIILVETLPYQGCFDLKKQLDAKLRIVNDIDADWVIHADADEIMHSCNPGESLRDAVMRADRKNYNIINFNEFVFLPIGNTNYIHDISGFQNITSYYFFQPFTPRLMRAWKKSANLSMRDQGGHVLYGGPINIYPDAMVLRHYIFRDQEHAYQKYENRRFAPEELAIGWHGNRVNQPVSQFRFPAADRLHQLRDINSRILETHSPRAAHYWEWPKGY